MTQAYDDAKKEYEVVKAKLERLEKLRSGATPKWPGEQANLERQEESLEEEKREWGKKIRELTQPGNDFVTWALGT